MRPNVTRRAGTLGRLWKYALVSAAVWDVSDACVHCEETRSNQSASLGQRCDPHDDPPVNPARTLRTRTSERDLSGRFAEVWPEVHAAVTRYLRARGIGDDAADDVAQEVAVRALATAVPFESPAQLTAWSLTVARRVAVDQYRRERFVDRMTAVPDRAMAFGVEQEVLARDTLARVVTEMAGMMPGDRALLLERSVGGRDARDRQYVRRHRLRKRLLRAAMATE